jgi:hypothetical protein
VGIFSHKTPLGSGDYRVQLNPRVDFERAAIQAGVSLAEYTFEITSIRFYLCIERANVSASGTVPIYLNECQVQTKTLSTGVSPSNLDFSVPPSTKRIAIFVQGVNAGSSNLVPLSSFKCDNRSDERLQNIQLTYSSKNSPSTNWTSEFSDGATDSINYLQQRYNDTMQATKLIYNPGGAQTFDQWLKSGGIYYFDFERDSMDRSVHLQLQMVFGSGGVSGVLPAGIQEGARVFVLSFYTKALTVTTTDGYISEVVSLST